MYFYRPVTKGLLTLIFTYHYLGQTQYNNIGGFTAGYCIEKLKCKAKIRQKRNHLKSIPGLQGQVKSHSSTTVVFQSEGQYLTDLSQGRLMLLIIQVSDDVH